MFHSLIKNPGTVIEFATLFIEILQLRKLTLCVLDIQDESNSSLTRFKITLLDKTYVIVLFRCWSRSLEILRPFSQPGQCSYIITWSKNIEDEVKLVLRIASAYNIRWGRLATNKKIAKISHLSDFLHVELAFSLFGCIANQNCYATWSLNSIALWNLHYAFSFLNDELCITWKRCWQTILDMFVEGGILVCKCLRQYQRQFLSLSPKTRNDRVDISCFSNQRTIMMILFKPWLKSWNRRQNTVGIFPRTSILCAFRPNYDRLANLLNVAIKL